MAYNTQSLLLSWLFRIDGTDEVADTSLHLTTGAGWDQAEVALDEITAAANGALYLGSMETLVDLLGFADYGRLTTFKAAALNTAGTYVVGTAAYVFEDSTPAAGAAPHVIPQATVCMSLRSGLFTGRANFGRMYIPYVLPALAAGTPYIPAANIGPIAGYFADFVSAVVSQANSEVADTLIPAILSGVGTGTTKEVVSVGAGRVVDTQRRRRNRLDDTATLQAL